MAIVRSIQWNCCLATRGFLKIYLLKTPNWYLGKAHVERKILQVLLPLLGPANTMPLFCSDNKLINVDILPALHPKIVGKV